MKNQAFLIASLCALLITSCTSTPDSLNAIPNDTDLVAVVSLSNLVSKSGVANGSVGGDALDELRKELRRDNRELAKFYSELRENPLSSGVDIKSDVFIYFYNEGEDEQYVNIVMDLTDSQKFEDLLYRLYDAVDEEFDMEYGDNYNYLLNGEVGFAWDTKKVIMLTATNYESREHMDYAIEDIFRLKADQTISSNSGFNGFYSKFEDLGLYVSSNILLNLDEYDIEYFEESSGYEIENFKDSNFSFYLAFKNGTVVATTDINYSDKLQAKVDEFNPTNAFNEEVAKVFPEESVMFGTSRFTSEPLVEYFDNVLADEIGEDEEDEFNSLLDLLEGLKGSMAYSIYAMETVEYSYMGWGYGFNEEIAERLDGFYPISEAGYLDEEEREKLNNGETIKSYTYSGKYCFNIQNVLDSGHDADYAIENNMDVIWYEGGWDYGKYIKYDVEEKLPMMGVTFDIDNSDEFAENLELFELDEEVMFEREGDIFYWMLNDQFPVYLAVHDGVGFFTNDENLADSFVEGKLESHLNSNANFNSNFISHFFLNLDYNSYPSSFKSVFDAALDDGPKAAKRVVEELDRMFASVEFSSENNSSVEMSLNLNDKSVNSLSAIISFIEKNYGEISELDS